MGRTALLAFAGLLLYQAAAAQALSLRNISVEAGLSSRETYKIIQDHNGYIWISTDAGLCRYNGRSFRVFTTSDGLPSNTMFDIMEDRYGRIWGGCFFGGVFYIAGDSVFVPPANAELSRYIEQERSIIRKLVLDEYDTLHIGTSLSYYRIYMGAGGGSDNVYRWPLSDANYTYCRRIGDDVFFSRVSVYPRLTGYMKYYLDDANGFHLAFSHSPYMSNNAPYFLVTPNGSKDLLFSENQYLMRWSASGVDTTFFPTSVIAAHADHRQNIWIGLWRGGFRMYRQGNFQAAEIQGLSGITVASFFEDREGGMWLTTNQAGVYYCPAPNLRLDTNFTGKNIVGLRCLDDRLFISTADNRWMERTGGKERLIGLDKTYVELDYSDLIIHRGQYYTTGSLLLRMISPAGTKPGRMEVLLRDFEVRQLAASGDSLWAINSRYLFLLNDNWSITEQYPLPSRGFCLDISAVDGILVGCTDGLYRFSDGRFQKMSLLPGNPNIRITCIARDREGRLALATRGHGVFLRVGKRWFNLNMADGLASDHCNHIYCSSSGRYYVSTNRGMSIVFPGLPLHVETISGSDGLPTQEVNRVDEYKDTVYIATERGLCYFPSSADLFNREKPRLVLTGLHLSGRELNSGGTYAYHQNDLSIHADMLAYRDAPRNGLVYRLYPVDAMERFIPTGEVNRDNLPPGVYTLELAAVNKAGQRSDTIRYTFTICKPYWNTYAFIILAALSFFSGSYLLMRWRVNRVRRRERERMEIQSRMIEYRQQALQAQMNPHFVFNVLNSIQLYVLKNKPRETYNYLAKFSKLIRRVLQNSGLRMVSLESELELLRWYVDLENIRMDGNIIFDIHVGEGISGKRSMVPTMLLQPILENAIWHGLVPLEGSRVGRINLFVVRDNGLIKFIVSDNGVGLKPASSERTSEKQSVGLKLIEERLKLFSNEAGIKVGNWLDNEGRIGGVEVMIWIPVNSLEEL